MHEPHVVARDPERGKGGVGVLDQRIDLVGRHSGIVRLRERARLAGADERRAAPRDERQHPALRRRCRERDVAGGLRRQQAHHLDQRVVAFDAKCLHHGAAARAGGVDGRAGANRQLAACRDVAHLHPRDACAFAHGPQRLDVVGERGAGPVRGGGERERQAIGLHHLIVVPLGAAGELVGSNAGEEAERGGLGDEPRRREVQLRLEPFVAVASEPGVDPERGPQRQAAAGRRSIGPDQERQRAEQPRRDARQGAALADRAAGVTQPPVLQRSQPAVHGALMIERGGAAEIVGVDERGLQPAAGGVVGDRQAVDAAADDEKIEGRAGKRVEVARAHARRFIL